MGNQIFKKALLCAGIILLAGTVHSQEWKVNSDQWSATDALGRTTPEAIDAGPIRDGKFNFVYNTNQVTGLKPVTDQSGADPSMHSYPNPFQDETTIEFSLHGPMYVGLSVYNSMGQQICTLLQGIKTGGIHRVSWSGGDDNGNQVEPGVYFYRLTTDSGTLGNGSMLKIK